MRWLTVMALLSSVVNASELRIKISEEISEERLRGIVVEQRKELHKEATTIVAEYPEKIKGLPRNSPERSAMMIELANAKRFAKGIPKEEALFPDIETGKKKFPPTWLKLVTINKRFTVREVINAQTFVGSKERFVISGGGLSGIKSIPAGNDYFVFKNWETKDLAENKMADIQAVAIECRKVNWGIQMIPLYVRVPNHMIGK